MAQSISSLRRKAKRARTVRRTISRSKSTDLGGLPIWVPISLGAAAIGGLVFAFLRSDSLRIKLNPLLHDVGEFFGLTEEHGIDTKNITHDRIYRSTIRS